MSNVRTIARPYAQAVFDFALAKSQLTDWLNFLNTLTVVAEDKRVVELVKNPQISDNEVANLFIRICGGGKENIAQPMQNFLHMVAYYHRLLLLPVIADIFKELKANYERTLTAKVFTFERLLEDQEKNLKEALEKRFKKKVHLEQMLDPNLLGGALIRVGDYVIDGSVRGKLERLRNHLNLKERV